jgi:hypothetical protein
VRDGGGRRGDPGGAVVRPVEARKKGLTCGPGLQEREREACAGVAGPRRSWAERKVEE